MLGYAELTKFDSRDEAYYAYAENARIHHEPVHSLDWFDNFWRGLKGLPRATRKDAVHHIHSATPTHERSDAIMAPTITANKGLKSPYLYDDVDVAYAAYKKMPHLKRAGTKVKTKKQFAKDFEARHAAAVEKAGEQNGASVRRSSPRSTPRSNTTQASTPDIDWSQFDESVIEQLRASGMDIPEPEQEDDEPTTGTPDPAVVIALASNPEALTAYLEAIGNTTTPTTARASTTKYKARTDRNLLPGGGSAYAEDDDVAPASNACLWALNTEGLIGEAYERAESNGDVLDTPNADGVPYITQAVGKALLAENFGPLPERTTASTR